MGGSLGKHSGTAQLRCRSDVTRTDRAPLNKLWDIAKQEATSYSNGSVKRFCQGDSHFLHPVSHIPTVGPACLGGLGRSNPARCATSTANLQSFEPFEPFEPVNRWNRWNCLNRSTFEPEQRRTGERDRHPAPLSLNECPSLDSAGDCPHLAAQAMVAEWLLSTTTNWSKTRPLGGMRRRIDRPQPVASSTDQGLLTVPRSG